MQTIGQPLVHEQQVMPHVEWTFTYHYSEQAALQLFEEQLAMIEQQASVTTQHIAQLQTTLNRLFLTRAENYWYGQARLNTLATRLQKSVGEQAVVAYPIALHDFDDMAFEINSNHHYFAYGKAARQWMKHWLASNGTTTFEHEASVRDSMALAVNVFQEFWSKFEALSSQAQWQQLMKSALGFEVEEPQIVAAFYACYVKGQPWQSLTSYQLALSKAAVPWEHLAHIPVAQHPFTKNVFLKQGIALS